METKKCDKCDYRGMIVDSPHPVYSAHSCECGYATSEEAIRKDIETLSKSNIVKR